MAWLCAFFLLPFICVAWQGPVPILSQPKCYIPKDDLHCSWGSGHNALVPICYVLHWNPDEDEKEGWINGTEPYGSIPRNRFLKYWDMCVWVSSGNCQSSREEHKSEKACFNTEHVVQPQPPDVYEHQLQPLKIFWKTHCLSMDSIRCRVQYRSQDWGYWAEGCDDCDNAFLLEDTQPNTVYDFRVKCACIDSEEVPLSNWSKIYEVKIAEAAPVGVLDVWSHCIVSRDLLNCALVWKELPRSQARGKVTGYVLTVEYSTGNKTVTNISTAMLESRQLNPCALNWSNSKGQCYCCLLPSLQGVTVVHLTAYNSKGETEPGQLALPIFDGLHYLPLSVAVQSNKDKRSFNVSWISSTEVVEQYVVQYEEVGHFHKFDWIKVNGSQRNAILTGDFRNYTPYNLSLFGILLNHRQLLASTISYTVQGVPPTVEGFQVSRVTLSEVMLTWQHVPLLQRRGKILRYVLGLIGNSTESAGREDSVEFDEEINSRSMSGLQPNWSYRAWICAETEQGQGQRNYITFVTMPPQDNFIRLLLILGVMFVIFVSIPFLLFCCSKWEVHRALFPDWCYDEVPDPINSHLFKLDQGYNTWRALSFPEANEIMSLLEVVEKQVNKDELCQEKKHMFSRPAKAQLGEPKTQEEVEEEQEVSEDGKGTMSDHSEMRSYETDSGSAAEGYSKMTDDDDDNCPLEKEPLFLDYEKHFMPSPNDL